VKFLLATTDPQKLPVTVLSRCLQFNLKRLPAADIAAHMRMILEREAVPFDVAGLKLVAQAADGSVRDALSLLDQLIAFGGGKAGEAEARAMLGTISRDHVVRLVELLAAANTQELLRCAQSLEEFAPDYAQVLDELAGLLVRVALKQVVTDYEGDELYELELLERLGSALAPEDVQLYYQTAITGRRDLPLAPDPRTGFEMTLLRMIAFRPGGEAARAGPPTSAAQGVARATPPVSAAADKQRAAPATGTPVVASVAAAAAPPALAPAEDGGQWAQIVSQLELSGAARQLASHCVFVGRQGAVVRLGVDPRNQLVRTPAQEDKLAQALSRYFGAPVRLEFQPVAAGVETPAQAQRRASEAELAAARRSFETEPGVQGLRERFGATVLPETVRPAK
jgi:DNA polymerase-3 subunit gamma/tau